MMFQGQKQEEKKKKRITQFFLERMFNKKQYSYQTKIH